MPPESLPDEPWSNADESEADVGADAGEPGLPFDAVADAGDDAAGFEWESPRWRQADEGGQGQRERDRRFRGSPAPSQRGAVDGPSITPPTDEA
jgi:hypothetical protein